MPNTTATIIIPPKIIIKESNPDVVEGEEGAFGDELDEELELLLEPELLPL